VRARGAVRASRMGSAVVSHVEVTRVSSNSAVGMWFITVRRLGDVVHGDPPPASDVPSDVRAALARWAQPPNVVDVELEE
jgi:hypothetical protein